MKKILLVGILALVVVGCVLAAGCTYDDDEAAAQLAMGNLGALSLGSGAMVTEEQIAQLDAALPELIAEVNAASGASMTGEKALELKKNIIFELEKASRASGYMTEDSQLDPSNGEFILNGDDIWFDFLKEADRASGTMMTDGQLAALGTAIEAKLGETSQASGAALWDFDVEYDYAAKDSYTPEVAIPGKWIFGASQASGTVWEDIGRANPVFIVS